MLLLCGVQLFLRSGVLTILDLDEVDDTLSFAEVFRSALSGLVALLVPGLLDLPIILNSCLLLEAHLLPVGYFVNAVVKIKHLVYNFECTHLVCKVFCNLSLVLPEHICGVLEKRTTPHSKKSLLT